MRSFRNVRVNFHGRMPLRGTIATREGIVPAPGSESVTYICNPTTPGTTYCRGCRGWIRSRRVWKPLTPGKPLLAGIREKKTPPEEDKTTPPET